MVPKTPSGYPTCEYSWMRATEHVAASKVSGGLWDGAGSVEGGRWSLLQRPVGPMPVVMTDEFIEHPAKASSAE